MVVCINQIGIVAYAEATAYRWRLFLLPSWVGQKVGSMGSTVFMTNVSAAQAKAGREKRVVGVEALDRPEKSRSG